MKKPLINPCGHYVLVKPEVIEKVSEGGIVLPDDMLNRENTAKVRGTLVAIGKSAWKAFDDGEPWAKVGDRVYFKRHVSDKIEDESDINEHGEPQVYFLMSDDNVLAIIEEQS
jgi:co-chaperonin GroES (HSP10)